MLYYLATAIFILFGIFWRYWNQSPRSIIHLPGPPSGPWLVGNLPGFERCEDAGDAHFEWTKKYGTAFRFKGCFGEDLLYISDPKALQYILNKSGYNFPKTWEARTMLALIADHGLIVVDGEQHARQRRVMNPSFSNSALKGYLPLFFALSRKTAATWTKMIHERDSEASILDVSPLLSRTTLDAIGEAAFGYKSNSIEGVEPKTELHKAYLNLFVDVHFMPSDFQLVFRRLLGYAPQWIVGILTSLPMEDLRRTKNYMSIARNVAKGLLEKHLQTHATSNEGGRDAMSIFVKANNSADPKRRLSRDEILPQITTLMLVGHATSGTTLSWMLYELSKHPEVQRKLREEVRTTRLDVAARGDSEMAISDLESMTYTRAVLMETLRYHPIVLRVLRRAGQDDVIPLGTPQQTIAGDTITAIPVRKGQVIYLGVASYNRLKSVWGEDADEWRPERFLEEPPTREKTNLGVLRNIASFGSGLRGCIGWRFAMIEMQAILIELIDNFEFSPAPNVEIRRASSLIVQSMVKGQEHKGVQMPLTVSIASRHNASHV